jgi:hypothetical protein
VSLRHGPFLYEGDCARMAVVFPAIAVAGLEACDGKARIVSGV